jgi:hypothetical protein
MRPPGSAAVLEARRRRALRWLDEGLTLPRAVGPCDPHAGDKGWIRSRRCQSVELSQTELT